MQPQQVPDAALTEGSEAMAEDGFADAPGALDRVAGCPGAPEGRRRDKEATKHALLMGGMEVFAARGYDAATTREVACRAGANEQLIQRYFGGKAGLLLAILEHFGSQEKQGACALPPPCATVEEEIASFLRFHLQHGCQTDAFFRVVLYRSIVDPAVAAEMARHVSESRTLILRARLQALQDRGAIDRSADLDALAAALSTFSFSLGFVDQMIFGVDPGRLERIANEIAALFAAGLRPGATKP